MIVAGKHADGKRGTRTERDVQDDYVAHMKGNLKLARTDLKFVVDAGNGYVVTNNHVVEDTRTNGTGASFDVVFSDNKKVSA